MKYLELQGKIKENLFTYLDVLKAFTDEEELAIKTQLYRFVKKGLLTKIKRGIYCFDAKSVDELELADRLYEPSYISLETALNYYGIMPDIPQGITSVNLTTTKKIINKFGSFYYTKIKPSLFFGFISVESATGSFFQIAKKEKALLDFFYIRRIKKTDDLRLRLKDIDISVYNKCLGNFPDSVKKIKI